MLRRRRQDKEAAGAWRTALIREGDAASLHVMLADAQLSQGRAIWRSRSRRGTQPLARRRGLKRRFAVAALLSGQRAEGLHAMDELLERRPTMRLTLAVAMLVLYDAFESDQASRPPKSIGRTC